MHQIYCKILLYQLLRMYLKMQELKRNMPFHLHITEASAQLKRHTDTSGLQPKTENYMPVGLSTQEKRHKNFIDITFLMKALKLQRGSCPKIQLRVQEHARKLTQPFFSHPLVPSADDD